MDGLALRLYEVPLKGGNYYYLALTKTHLYFSDYVRGADKSQTILKSMKITNEDPEPEEVLNGIQGFEFSGDRKKIIVHKDDSFYVFDANGKAPGKQQFRCFVVDEKFEW